MFVEMANFRLNYKTEYRNILKWIKVILKTIVLILLFSICRIFIFSNENPIQFEHISIAQGLSQSTVFCVFQDSTGYMWFGTQYGLNRYDGHTFKQYVQNPKVSGNLSYNMVLCIHEDKNGRFWIGTWGGGLNLFDRKTETFKSYQSKVNNLTTSPGDDNICCIMEDESGILWLGTEGGIDRFDTELETFSHYLYNNSTDKTENARIYAIFKDSSNILWAGGDLGLFSYNNTQKKFEFFSPLNMLENGARLSIKKVKSIMEFQPGVLIIGTEEGLLILDRNKNVIGKYSDSKKNSSALAKDSITSILVDKRNQLWIGTQKEGLYLFHPGNTGPVCFKNEPNNPTAISDDYIRTIYEDKNGLIWIGTQGGGVNKYDPRRKKFDKLPNIKGNTITTKSSDVTALCLSSYFENCIWIGTRSGGLNLYNKKTGLYSSYPISESFTKSSNRDFIRALMEDKNTGTLWVGTERAGLYQCNLKNGEFELIKTINADAYILKIYKDSNNMIWIGTQGDGLFQMDEMGNVVQKYNKTNGWISDKVYDLIEDEKGMLWIGTSNGIRLLEKGKQKAHFTANPTDKCNLSSDFVTVIFKDRKKELWVGTNGGGINKFDTEKNRFITYTTANGLVNNVIYAIEEDSTGNLWISTNYGLSRFNPEAKKFRNYTVRDGLQDYEFNSLVSAASPDGKMYFGGVKGINEFDPTVIIDTSTPAPIVITSIKIIDNKGLIKTFNFGTKLLEFSYDFQSLLLEFAALDFSDPENNRYSYKLETANKEWIELGKKHDINLTKVEPGEYTFRVKGANSEGIWNDTGSSLRLIITPPFYKTTFSIIFSICIIVVGTFFFIRWRVNDSIKKRKTAQKEYDRLKKEMDDRKKVQEKLKESEELYRSLVETSPESITLYDLKGKIIMTNKQTALLLGYESVEELLKRVKTITGIIIPADRNKTMENMEAVKLNGLTSNIEFNMLAKNGKAIAVEISTALIKDSEGNPKSFLGIARDIRERKEEEKRALSDQQTEKMISLGTLISGVAHELNNPAGYIMTNSESFSKIWADIAPILDRYASDGKDFKIGNVSYEKVKPKINELIKGLLEGSTKIKKIIQELRDYARPEDSTERKILNINNVIESALNLTHNTIKNATHKFDQKLEQDLPLIWGHFQQLEQVIINLILNACQALPGTDKGIIIKTGYDSTKSRVFIKVIDEGTGISETDLKFILDPFFTTKRSKGGIGLGLSISQRILKEHNGEIEFFSEPGKGTMVMVSLPVLNDNQTEKNR